MVEMSVFQKQGGGASILYSYRASLFTSGNYQWLLENNDLISSMIVIDHCADDMTFDVFPDEMRTGKPEKLMQVT